MKKKKQGKDDLAREDCPTCGGNGECVTCDGYGFVSSSDWQDDDEETCSTCNGSGECQPCGGDGVLKGDKGDKLAAGSVEERDDGFYCVYEDGSESGPYETREEAEAAMAAKDMPAAEGTAARVSARFRGVNLDAIARNHRGQLPGLPPSSNRRTS